MKTQTMNNPISSNQQPATTSSSIPHNPSLLNKASSFNTKVHGIAGDFHRRQANRWSEQNGLVKFVSSPLMLASGSPAAFAAIGLYQLGKSAVNAIKKSGEQSSASNANTPTASRVTERTHLLRNNSAD